jgi:hypothetical protein
VDLDAATITVRRSAGLIRVAGEGADVVEGPTKTNKPRVIDLDPGTAEVLRGLEAPARRPGPGAGPR